MKNCKVIIEDYGKIKRAEIEPARLNFFVGDNNSGKSYILSMLWAIQNFGIDDLIPFSFFGKNETGIWLCEWMSDKIDHCIEDGMYHLAIYEVIDRLQMLLNESLENQKNNIVKKIFNSDDIDIGKLQIQLNNNTNTVFDLCAENDVIWLDSGKIHVLGIEIHDYETKQRDQYIYIFIKALYSNFLDINFNIRNSIENIYLPAARTGFMLTKNIINQVGRDIAFNVDASREQITPFIRPINQFLDIINSLSEEVDGDPGYSDLIAYVETQMAGGKVDINDMPSKEVMYVPDGKNTVIPLRAVSGVVSELSPLILILKHNGYINSIYFEEPEMCLHPQLQHKMAKVICNLVNMGIDMTVTTHSDIILQYINNMIALSKREDKLQIFDSLGYTNKDIVLEKDIKVYQFMALDNGESRIIQLECGQNGFIVDTFNDALDKIMNEAYMIQE